jgi:CheY-like chemotaxis protein
MPKILIVDDDPDIVESTKVILEAEGFAVISALNPEEAIEKAKQEAPDLILLDVMMTQLDSGFDAARSLRQEPSTANIPIVILTALRQKMGFDFRSESGDKDWLPVEAYLEKPIKREELLATIKRLLKS